MRRRDLVLLLLAACEVPRGVPGLLDFLADGRTTRDEVLLRLGAPAGRYEEERVLIYTLGEDGGYYVIAPGGLGPAVGLRVFDLTVVFDGGGVLRRHGLAERMR